MERHDLRRLPVLLLVFINLGLVFAAPQAAINPSGPTPSDNQPVNDSSQAAKVEVKINIPLSIDMGEAVLTSSNPTTRDYSIMNCFDGKSETTFISNGQEIPTRVQIMFLKPKPVSKIRVLIGEPGFEHVKNNWWIEAANTQDELNLQMGSYEMVVPAREVAGNWDEFSCPKLINKKIWKLCAKKNAYDECVQIHEFEIWVEN
jgi:hypothetical protein